MTVFLIGAGMGTPETMTLEGKNAIEKSGALIGAPRLLEGYPGKVRYPLIAAEQIAVAVKGCGCETVSVLLSGDVGFYSGARRLYELLDFAEVITIPGISTLVYFCAKLHTPWQDIFLVSAHGRSHNAVGEIQRRERVFVLTGGSYLASDLITALCDRGLGNVSVSVGERLSYPDEHIVRASARELCGCKFDSLAVVLAENPKPVKRKFTAPYLRDENFIRDRIPMTKEEVRAVSIAKLRLKDDHTVWDVGAGTGSVTCEAALAVPAGRVFAVERKPEAAALIRENCLKLALSNVHVAQGTAPEALCDLPAPDRVFLGGTAGNMEAILSAAMEKNPDVRVVINAVTLETVSEAVRCFAALGLDDTDMVQLSATRTRNIGGYHMMDAQNPVWVIAGEVRRERA